MSISLMIWAIVEIIKMGHESLAFSWPELVKIIYSSIQPYLYSIYCCQVKMGITLSLLKYGSFPHTGNMAAEFRS
jgi:hypothetical protein